LEKIERISKKRRKLILGFVRFLKKKKKKRKKERQKIEVRTRLQSRGSVWADEVDHEPHSQGWWV